MASERASAVIRALEFGRVVSRIAEANYLSRAVTLSSEECATLMEGLREIGEGRGR